MGEDAARKAYEDVLQKGESLNQIEMKMPKMIVSNLQCIYSNITVQLSFKPNKPHQVYIDAAGLSRWP